MYIDAQDFHLSGEELYDMGGKLWKIIDVCFRGYIPTDMATCLKPALATM